MLTNPKQLESKRPRIRIYKQFKRDISKGIYTNSINISQFITFPLSRAVKSSSGKINGALALIQLANWLWLFVKKKKKNCTSRMWRPPPPPLPFLLPREKTSPQRLFNGVCTNKISLFDQSSAYRGCIQWARQSEVFWLSEKFRAKTQKRCDILPGL